MIWLLVYFVGLLVCADAWEWLHSHERHTASHRVPNEVITTLCFIWPIVFLVVVAVLVAIAVIGGLRQ